MPTLSFTFSSQGSVLFSEIKRPKRRGREARHVYSFKEQTFTMFFLSIAKRSSKPTKKKHKVLHFPNKHPFSKNNSLFGSLICNTQLGKLLIWVGRASTIESELTKSESKSEGGGGGEYEEYEVEIEQPYGLKFMKGRDGGTYIDAIAPGGSAYKTGLFTVGDKVLAASAVSGTEIWPAAEYGKTM